MDRKFKSSCIALIALALSLDAAAQSTITGKVSSSANGISLTGAHVYDVGGKEVAMTDSTGSFSLKVNDLKGVLRVEAPSYEMQLVPLQGRSTINIYLHPVAANEPMFDEWSLSANSATTTSQLSPSSASVDEDINMRLSGVLHSNLQSGIDAAAATTMIRGIHTINTSITPLYIVDGVIWQDQCGITSLNEGYFSNPLALISPDDIESVQVLKDGTAIYGSKASGGVIIIKTKHPTNMATEITVNLSTGFRSPFKTIPMMDANSYRIYATDVMSGMEDINDMLDRYSFLDDDVNSSSYLASHNNTNWLDEINGTGILQNYGLSVRGGDNVALYSFSLGYQKNEGNVENTDFQRLNVRFNSDIKLTKRFTAQADIAFSQVTRSLFDDGINEYTSPIYLAYIKSPLYNPYQVDASGNFYDHLSDTDELGIGNPLAIIENADNESKNYRFTASLIPKYEFSDRLSAQILAAFSWDKIKEKVFTPDFGLAEIQFLNDQGDWYGEGDNMVASLMTRHSTLTLGADINWKPIKTLSQTLDLRGGMRYQGDTFESSYGKGYNTGSDNLKSLSVTNSSLRTMLSTDESWKTLNWYVQGNYNILNKYLFSATLNLETDSRFGDDAKSTISFCGLPWGFFPSITGAWILSNETFMRNLPWVNYMKIHAGYDVTGNSNIPVTASRTYFDAITLAGLARGLQLANIGNQKLTYERTGTLSLGVDMSLLSNRLGFSFDVYNAHTNNLLVRKQLREEYGLENYWSNDGKLTNKGFEFQLKGRIIDHHNWKLNASAMMGHYKNEVTELTGDQMTTELMDGEILTAVGHPVGVFYGYSTQGVFSTQAEAEAANLSIVAENGQNVAFGAGDVHFVDLNNDNIIDENDKQIIGDPNPDIYGNFNLSLQYKGFTLGTLFTYSVGNDAYNALRAKLESGSSLNNQTKNMLNRWTADGQVTDVPRATYDDPMGNSRFSDRWIEDASFLKLKQVMASYKLPIKPHFIQGLSVWVAVNNVFTVTKYLGSDPEFSYGYSPLSQGIDAGLTPSSRTYLIGLKLNL
ncbi:MAG: SusC/RagA family TonB-linked outer membrane protein [Prevotella sp.]|jgi:TonB-linked SusC/RagA family outer membrane protein